MLRELQLEGLPGPTHHFGGLAKGNVASMASAGTVSRPRAAALQCLGKMRKVLGLGASVAVLPPLQRPDIPFLRSLGFSGSDGYILQQAANEDPYLIHLAQSSAAMWTANCATVIPSTDAADGRCHMVVANLATTPHRVLEGGPRADMLRRIFTDPGRVQVHDPLPVNPLLGDEGAANHHRLAIPSGQAWHLMVYNRAHGLSARLLPRRYPARQSREASLAVARLGRLVPSRTLLVRQNPIAVDAGAFHNDVVMMGEADLLVLHQHALADQAKVVEALSSFSAKLRVRVVQAAELTLGEAVNSYLFNSQLVATAAGRVLVAPGQCGEGKAEATVQRLLDEGLIARVVLCDLDQSMHNGGGPACLRLRVPLTETELKTVHPGVLLDEMLLGRLEAWVQRNYRTELSSNDLGDPELLRESYTALDELSRLLNLEGLYPFQRDGGSMGVVAERRATR